MEKKILRWPEVKSLVGLARSTIDKWEKQGAFPKRVKLGFKLVVWFSDEIDQWIEAHRQ